MEEEQKTVKELVADIEKKINNNEPEVMDNLSELSLDTEYDEHVEELYKVVILKSKNTENYSISIKSMRITNCLILNNFISRYKNYCKGKTKKYNSFYGIVMLDDVYLQTLYENVNSYNTAEGLLTDYVNANENKCIDLQQAQPLIILDKVRTVKVDPKTGIERTKYSRTYSKNTSCKYDAEKCKEYYIKNRSKRMEYSKKYYEGLKKMAFEKK